MESARRIWGPYYTSNGLEMQTGESTRRSGIIDVIAQIYRLIRGNAGA